MEQLINLKKLEKNSIATIFQTGLVDIEVGLVFIVGALAMIFDDISYWLMILYIVPFLFIILAIKYISAPRMGMVKPAKRRIKRTRYMVITITTFLVITVGFTIFGNTNIFSGNINPRWIITAIIFLICVSVAFFISFDRMYIYAFLLSGAFNLSEEIRENPGGIEEGGYAYLLVSVILIIIGTIYLVRFLKKYPLPEKETE